MLHELQGICCLLSTPRRPFTNDDNSHGQTAAAAPFIPLPLATAKRTNRPDRRAHVITLTLLMIFVHFRHPPPKTVVAGSSIENRSAPTPHGALFPRPRRRACRIGARIDGYHHRAATPVQRQWYRLPSALAAVSVCVYCVSACVLCTTILL